MNQNKIAYRISSIEDYGKFMAFCIDKDINVWRTYWNEREKGDRCYSIDWREKRCYYSSERYYIDNDYIVIDPTFSMNAFGDYYIEHDSEVLSV